jgi:hypothetical protein
MEKAILANWFGAPFCAQAIKQINGGRKGAAERRHLAIWARIIALTTLDDRATASPQCPSQVVAPAPFYPLQEIFSGLGAVWHLVPAARARRVGRLLPHGPRVTLVAFVIALLAPQ